MKIENCSMKSLIADYCDTPLLVRKSNPTSTVNAKDR